MLSWAGAWQGADKAELFPLDIAFEPFFSRTCVEDRFIYRVVCVCVSKQANEDFMKQMFSAAVCGDVSCSGSDLDAALRDIQIEDEKITAKNLQVKLYFVMFVR